MEQKRIAKAIKDYINENYRNYLTISIISNELFVSHSTACHYFKCEYGITIKKYLNDKRAEEAKRLIENGHSPTLVSEKLGFYNYTTFYRIYKKRFGTAPSTEKRKSKNSQD